VFFGLEIVCLFQGYALLFPRTFRAVVLGEEFFAQHCQAMISFPPFIEEMRPSFFRRRILSTLFAVLSHNRTFICSHLPSHPITPSPPPPSPCTSLLYHVNRPLPDGCHPFPELFPSSFSPLPSISRRKALRPFALNPISSNHTSYRSRSSPPPVTQEI